MIYLIFLFTIFGISRAQYWHHGVQDTPEVASAKAEHFAAVQRAKLSTASNHLSGLYKKSTKPLWTNNLYGPSTKYSGPIALPPGYDKNGAPLPVLDTPEVAAEKAKHFALVARSAPNYYENYHDKHDNHEKYDQFVNEYYLGGEHSGEYRKKRSADLGFNHGGFAAFNNYQNPGAFFAHDSLNKYHGPIALPPGYDKHGAPLPVLDTPEVAQEKAKHLAIVAKERAISLDHLGGGDGGHFYGLDGFSVGNHGGFSYGIHDGAFSGFSGGALGFHNSFTPTIGPYGNDFKFQGPIALSRGFDKQGGPHTVLDTSEKNNQFAEFAKITANHQLGRNHLLIEHF